MEAADEVPECISFNAVCDGIDDCRNGNDELPSRCNVLTPTGSSWGGDLQWIGCESHRAKRIHIIVTRTRQDPVLKSYMHLTATVVYTWMENGATHSHTEQAEGHYGYGEKAINLRASQGGHVSADIKCMFINDRRCQGMLYNAITGTICTNIVLFRQ